MMRKKDQDLEDLLEKDREDEIRGLEKFTEEDYAFLEELREMEKEFN